MSPVGRGPVGSVGRCSRSARKRSSEAPVRRAGCSGHSGGCSRFVGRIVTRVGVEADVGVPGFAVNSYAVLRRLGTLGFAVFRHGRPIFYRKVKAELSSDTL
jgi:hypothetical protein